MFTKILDKQNSYKKTMRLTNTSAGVHVNWKRTIRKQFNKNKYSKFYCSSYFRKVTQEITVDIE